MTWKKIDDTVFERDDGAEVKKAKDYKSVWFCPKSLSIFSSAQEGMDWVDRYYPEATQTGVN